MEIFLSWSGDRSRRVAEAFRDWLPQVIQAVVPWISLDIDKGDRWSAEISDHLSKSRIGIFCLTTENLAAPWLLFEAGAVSKSASSRACTFLLDLKPGEVKQPLGQFQATQFDKADVLKLVTDINAELPKADERAVPAAILEAAFEKFWPELEKRLTGIKNEKPIAAKAERDDSDKLDEALELLRGIHRRIAMSESFPLTLANIGNPTVSGGDSANVSPRMGGLLGIGYPPPSPEDIKHINYLAQMLRAPKRPPDDGKDPP